MEEVPIQTLIFGAAGGMVQTLDPFSQFLEPDLHRELKTDTEGEFGGLGLRLTVKDEWLTVITPLPGSPAYRLGILPNDRVSEIDGQTTKDVTLGQALKKLRGSPGTKVKLLVLRGPDESAAPGGGDVGEDGWTRREYSLTRETIKIESVHYWKIDPDVGYVRINEFSARTGEDVASAIAKLRKDGAASLIVDLRNNPGGLLSAAIEVASLFLDESKLIVSTRGRRIDKPQEFKSRPKAPHPDIPMVLLVNEGSASGSEIIAGALQDHRRAVVMGGRTYGKASVQSVIPLADGSGLRLTVARYYTPAGRMIHRDEKAKTGGIKPDIPIAVSRETESRLYSQWEMIYAKDRKPRSIAKDSEQVRDEVLDRAVQLLRAREALGNLRVDLPR